MDQQPADPQNTTKTPAPVTPVTDPHADPLPDVPQTWPGAFGVYKYSSQAVRRNIGTLIIIWLVSVILSIILQKNLGTVGQILGFLVNTMASVGLTLTYIASVRKQRLSVGDAVTKSFLPLLLKMIGLNILVSLSLALSLLLLVMPFFFVFPRLVLAPYFLVDKNMGIIDAYKVSWETAKGHGTKVWGIVGASILMALLMITIIGIPFALYLLIMYSGATAVLYEFLNKARSSAPSVQTETPAANAEPSAPTPAAPAI